MSTEALGAPTGIPAGELAIAERVQHLQVLIEQTRQSASGASPTLSSTVSGEAQPANFAAALQAASGANSTTPVSYQAPGDSTQSSSYDSLIEQAAQRYGVEPALLHGLIEQESGFDPNAQSSAGAAGLTQLMPGTASSMGVANPLDPTESIEGGARYLSQLMTQFGGNTADALAAYNAGPGAVQQYGGVPPYSETQSYVAKVLGYAETYRQGQTTPNATGVAA
jgi:soluble lytic murein transglycosylase-like protein